MQVKLTDIINIYNNLTKTVKNKNKLYNFEKNKMQNISIIYDKLTNGYDGGNYNIFLIKDPKKRIVMSQNIIDKTINHYVNNYILVPKLTKYLLNTNVATRKNMGTSKANYLLNKYIEKHKKNNKFYILKMDIEKYFYNIDHIVLINLLNNILIKDELNLVIPIIKSTNKNYINNKIKKLNIDINYKQNKGLPLGTLTSQTLAIFYLSEIDKILQNKYKVNFIHFMDDYIILNKSKLHLQNILKEIKKILNNKYKLNLNKKTLLINSNETFEFIGKTYKIKNKKTIKKIKNKTIYRIKKNYKLKTKLYNKNKLDKNKYINMKKTYKSYNNSKINRIIKNNKKINLNNLINKINFNCE